MHSHSADENWLRSPMDCVLTMDLQELITHLEADWFLFEPDQVRRRIDALAELDAHVGGELDFAVDARVGAMRARIEAGNAEFYERVRREIREDGKAGALPRLLM